jgi:hypothetical protein
VHTCSKSAYIVTFSSIHTGTLTLNFFVFWTAPSAPDAQQGEAVGTIGAGSQGVGRSDSDVGGAARARTEVDAEIWRYV